jgi:CHAT domain-containing protein
MAHLDILLIDDDQRWQDEVPKVLQRLGNDVQIEVVSTYEAALDKIDGGTYDLAVVDLSLVLLPLDKVILEPSDLEGLELMERWGASKYNCGRGLIVLSGYGNPQLYKKAFKNYGVDDFIDKGGEWFATLPDAARIAILKGRLRHAALRDKQRYLVNVTYSTNSLVSVQLAGPDVESPQQIIDPPFEFKIAGSARKTNKIEELLESEELLWRNEAAKLGKALHSLLLREPSINKCLSTALARAREKRDVRLQFSGPAAGLGLPFELLHDENDYLCFDHIMTRRLQLTATKPEPFHDFITGLTDKDLHILMIGANSDGTIPASEVEAKTLAKTINVDLNQIGKKCSVKLLVGSNASYEKVRSELQSSLYHIIHYSGHCYFDEEHPESSGLELRNGDGVRILTANQLNMLCKEKPRLRLVYLSCCLGARAPERLNRGDFYGILEALARAGVPILLGYRWSVVDASALRFSTAFYDELWRTFSPGNALVEARKSIAMGRGEGDESIERDDDAWASPVLVIQSRM